MSMQTLTDTGTVHVINVNYVDGSIHVSPDPLTIHSADSVHWEFRGIPEEWGRAIRFSQPAGVDPNRGPFTGSLSAAGKVSTIIGSNADDKPCEYKYDVVLTKPSGTRIELDPVIDNQGPPGVMPASPKPPKRLEV
jgi:hypothetical protein